MPGLVFGYEGLNIMGPLWGRCRKHHYTHPKHQPRDIYIAWENGSNSQFLLVVDGGWGVCVGSSDTAQSAAAGSHNAEGGREWISLPDCKDSQETSNHPVAFVRCTQTSLARKVVLCLMELRTVISRLQKKNLFPYNPASLVKLLTLIEEKSELVS